MGTEIGLAFRLARTATGKSQWEIAKKLGLHPVAVNYIELGKNVPSAIVAKAMLEAIRSGAPKSRFVNNALGKAERISDYGTS